MLTDFKPLLKNSKFKYLWASQIFSQFAIYIMNFLFLVRIFEETGSTIATSFLWVAFALPAITIGPFAAASVDMVDRRRLLISANLLQFATIFLYALSHRTSIFLLYGAAVAYSFLNQFYVPAELAALPTLLSKKRLPQANGLFFITQQVAVVVGFSLAGVLKNIIGFTTTLFLCAGFLFMAFIAVSRLPKMKTKDSVPKNFEKALFAFYKRIIEGYRYIKDNNYILVPLALMLILHTTALVMVVNMPALAEEILKIDLNLGGLFIGVPGGLGALIGAVIVPRFLKRGFRKIRVIETSFVLITASLFILTLIVPSLSGNKGVLLGVFTTFAAGFSFAGILIPSLTFLQEATPSGMRGRVFGNYWFLATMVTLFPVIFSGTITELFGVRILLIIISIISLSILFFIKKYGNKFIESGFSITKVRGKV